MKVAYTLPVRKTIHVYPTYLKLKWVFTFKSIYDHSLSFTDLLSPYHLRIKRSGERNIYLLRLLQSSITSTVGLDESLAYISPCPTHRTVVCFNFRLLCARRSTEFSGFVMTFHGLSKTTNHGRFVSYA